MTELTEQAAKILGPLSGVATIWSLDLGLRLGLFRLLEQSPQGASADEIASELGLDALYTQVILRSAFAAEVLNKVDGRYVLAEHMDTLLLSPDAPAYLGGAVKTLVALRETYLDIREFANTGQREWWSDFTPEWIDAVGENGQTYYRRMLSAVIPQLPKVEATLNSGARYLDLACGVCRGPAKIVQAFPKTKVTAVDADRYSLDVARSEMTKLGLAEHFDFVESYLERLGLQGGHDLAVINISLHEARDIELAVEQAYQALDEGGVFLVSEFPFPENEADCRTVPGRLMCGVQAFEAHIGCQLLPTRRFVELLSGAGFKEVGSIDVTPMQVVVHGTK